MNQAHRSYIAYEDSGNSHWTGQESKSHKLREILAKYIYGLEGWVGWDVWGGGVGVLS